MPIYIQCKFYMHYIHKVRSYPIYFYCQASPMSGMLLVWCRQFVWWYWSFLFPSIHQYLLFPISCCPQSFVGTEFVPGYYNYVKCILVRNKFLHECELGGINSFVVVLNILARKCVSVPLYNSYRWYSYRRLSWFCRFPNNIGVNYILYTQVTQSLHCCYRHTPNYIKNYSILSEVLLWNSCNSTRHWLSSVTSGNYLKMYNIIS